MGTVDRSYSYHDDGVLPSQGEYGVTYLTLYSSGAGNHYDGWMWDPDRIHYSETERTYGYRNPDYPDYCWDDEVVVDLSNAQARQESSEFEQGRITSFNTNVSNSPIVLQDVDITGLTEEEREEKATTVLFSAIPLVKDAYIHAEVEIQAKMNISPDNTNGTVRLEAFYIINNESDRTMRPNPVDHRAVCTADERNTFRFLYWNPALSHEDHNYIGVKLLCTGGTAEIGISDNPAYGDAIITLTSAGLTGDHIDEGRPVSLDIYGKSVVIPNYRLNIDDYTVLCTYDTGEVYDVTRLCTFSPLMGTRIINPMTQLTATYMGLTASMTILLAQVTEIEIIPVSTEYENTYTFDIDDYVVYARFSNDDILDITDDPDLTFSPAMGTTITQTTTLTATYAPSWAQGTTYTDSVEIDIVTVTPVVTKGGDIIYTLYDNGTLVISGEVNSSWNVVSYQFNNYSGDSSNGKYLTAVVNGHGTNGKTSTVTENWTPGSSESPYRPETRDANFYYEVKIPSSMLPSVRKIRYELQGKPLGFTSNYQTNSTTNGCPWGVEFVGFENIDTSRLVSMRNAFVPSYNDFNNNGYNEIDFSFLSNMQFPALKDLDKAFYHCNLNDLSFIDTSSVENFSLAFNSAVIDDDTFLDSMDVSSGLYFNCMLFGSLSSQSLLDNIDFLYNWDTSNAIEFVNMLAQSDNITNINSVRVLNTSHLENCSGMFKYCTGLITINNTIGNWNTTNLSNASSMFKGCTSLSVVGQNADFFTNMAQNSNIIYMFKNTALESTIGLSGCIGTNILYVAGLFQDCLNLHDLSGCASWYMGNKTHISYMFDQCPIDESSISYLTGWDMSNVVAMADFMNNPPKVESSHPDYQHPYEYPALDLLSDWNVKRKQGLSMNDSGAFGSSSTSAVLPTVVTYDPDTQQYGLKIVPTWYKNRTT